MAANTPAQNLLFSLLILWVVTEITGGVRLEQGISAFAIAINHK
jgi:hypothetical protein